MLKKIFLILIIGIFAFQLGSSVLPHSHGMDFNHSKHADCPLYQLSLSLFATAISLAAIIFSFAFFKDIADSKEPFVKESIWKLWSPRAPPLGLLNVTFIRIANLSLGEHNGSKFGQIKFNRNAAFSRNIYD